VARLAVAEERLRFARDLHDLLGHSLSLVALKCDLAHELVDTTPARAKQEIREAATVTRSALREVREAVAGYRQMSLAAELAGAREVLAAAGIGLQVEQRQRGLPPAAEAALAWAVREAVTNVVRHSRAHHCRIRIGDDQGGISLEVTDDGRGAPSRSRPAGLHSGDSGPAGSHPGGSGLAGLAERLAAVGGYCRAEPLASGGFRLTAWLPTSA
jgi:two-component system sensor histidine kinase DesK